MNSFTKNGIILKDMSLITDDILFKNNTSSNDIQDIINQQRIGEITVTENKYDKYESRPPMRNIYSDNDNDTNNKDSNKPYSNPRPRTQSINSIDIDDFF